MSTTTSDRLDAAFRRLADEYGTDASTLKSRLEASLDGAVTLRESEPTTTKHDTMSTTTTRDATLEALKKHRLSDLWRPARVEQLRDGADTAAERDVLEAVLDYNQHEKDRGITWSPGAVEPIRGMSYEALASRVQEVDDGDFDLDPLAGSGRSMGTPADAVETADPDARRQALRNLRKAPTFDRKDMEGHADTLRAEAADLLGVDGHEDIDVDTLADRVDLDIAAPDEDGDGLEVDTMASYERVEQAEAKRKKAEAHRAAGRPKRADELEAEIDTLLAGLDREELTDAGYDTLAEYIPRDYDAMASEIDDPGELAAEIDTLEKKARSMRGRGMDVRADEVEAELEALRERAGDV